MEISIIKRPPLVPKAPNSIQKGSSLADLLDAEAIECLALNIYYVDDQFKVSEFITAALTEIADLSLMQRSKHIAKALKNYLPENYQDAIKVLTDSFTAARFDADDFGLGGFFYLPHSSFIAGYGIDAKHNAGSDPFQLSMQAMYQLTMRFSSEFAIRDFLIKDQARTLEFITPWLEDKNPHVRRLCSEGTRPKLPWGKRLPALIEDPTPVLPILTKLKDDESLYVRRSVANHLGDIAKNHPQLVFSLCHEWLEQGSNKELNWLIRHALRYPAKKGDKEALKLRILAK